MASPPHRDAPARLRAVRPLTDFLSTEAAGGVVALVAVVVALVWANSPWSDAYTDLWSTMVGLRVGGHGIELDLVHWVNDGLMAIFFLVVGLEIKRELVEGELRDPRRAAFPAIAAIGGMVVPALLYVAFNGTGDGARGWGVPMATDIALALAVLSLVGSRLHPSLKPFLLTLAIVDDIGAILVIAIFYSSGVEARWLLVAVLSVLAAVMLRRVQVRLLSLYVVLGVLCWFALHEAHIHPTLAGVVFGLLAPTQPFLRPEFADADELADVSSVESARATVEMARSTVSVVEWLEHRLHPWTSFGVVPLFALANAGVVLSIDGVRDAAGSAVTLGVVLGLVVGKPLGIGLFAWLSVRTGIARAPEGVRAIEVFAVAALAGIGFTVSLFVTGLAFDDPSLQRDATIGVLAAFVVSTTLGALACRWASISATRRASSLAVPAGRRS